MRTLTIATKNAHKVHEIRALLGDGWQVAGLDERPDLPAPEETGETFAANAQIKALAFAGQIPGILLADDSGLEVDALGGAPGVHSARYSGPGATDASNRAKLLAALREQGPGPWPARFRCAMALAEGLTVLGVFEGAVEGRIIPEERGEGGFGYDALFIPDGYESTFAELPLEVKNSLSHRARALAQAMAFLQLPRESGPARLGLL